MDERATSNGVVGFLRGRPWLRAGIVLAVLAAVAWALLPEEERSRLSLVVAFYAGAFLPAVLIGAVAGWLTFSKPVWLWTTGLLGLLTLPIVLLMAFGSP